MTINLKAKKERIINYINAVDDETTIDEISAKVLGPFTELPESEDVLKYLTQVEEEFDLEKLAREQNYTGIDMEKIDRILADFDVPQSTEELLAMLD